MKVGVMKQTVNTELLLRHMPHEFKEILDHISELTYFDCPDYDKLDKLLDHIMKRRQIDFSDPFDWEALPLAHGTTNNHNVGSGMRRKNKIHLTSGKLFRRFV